MNILVPVSWLRDFIKTKAKTKDIARVLSLCSQSVEHIYQQKGDDVLDIEITSNRPDCLSVVGLARELYAILPRFNFSARLNLPTEEKIDFFLLKPCPLEVKINPPSICPRFTAILIENVTIKPSPELMKKRLHQIGLRPINNVVDISNYLMFETGQPIHTFDYDKIKEGKMIMRLSQKGETVITLDGVKRVMPGGDIVIEDGNGRLIDLCGIMGAENSAIDKNTKRVLFFVQAYTPHLIRRTSMLLGHRTEAAVRFEKGIDLENIPFVVKRGARLMEKLTGGNIASKIIDIYPKRQKSPQVNLSFNFAQKLIGEKIPPKTMIDILDRLGFKLIKKTKDNAQFLVPSWRIHDVSLEEDLIEEIARIYGYFNLKSQLPPLPPHWRDKPIKKVAKGKFPPLFYWREKIKDFLRYQGFWEAYSYSFISKKIIENAKLKSETHLALQNPISQELKYMRRQLLPSLLHVFSQNQARFPKISLYEIANTYQPQKDDLPRENLRLTAISSTKNILQLKGILESLLSELGLKEVNFLPVEKGSVLAKVCYQKQCLGWIKEIEKDILRKFNIEEKISAFDLDVDLLSSLANKKKTFNIPSPYPPIIEDLTFVFPAKTYLGPVIQSIKSLSKVIKNVAVVDSFGHSRTLRLTFQSSKHNLTGKEIKELRRKIITTVERKFKGKLKGKSTE